ERGIVQGEFGFITADGIYHVTVYATDENGKFKILRMRNIRISAPLDGSPFTGEISPEAEKYRKQAGLPALTADQSPSAPTPSPVAIPSPVVTNNPAPFAFTTQPTVKPACASCGYITTPAPLPGQNGANTFQFQNPAFNKEDQSKYQQPQQQQAVLPGPSTGGSLPLPPQGPSSNISPYQAAKGPQYTNYQSGQQLGQNVAGAGVSQPGLPQPSYPGDGAFVGVPAFGPGQNFAGIDTNQPSAFPASSYPGDGALAGAPGSELAQNFAGIGANQPGGIPAPSYPGDGSFVGSPESVPAQNFAGYPGDGSYAGSPESSGLGNNLPASLPAPAYPGVGAFGGSPQSGSVAGYPGDGSFVASPGSSFGSNNNAIGSNAGDDGLIYDTGVIYGQNGFGNVNGVAPPTTDILPPIEVSDNNIHVGGSHPQDIPIKDKYPGMQDGLPEGINEKDITDLLYKFHYTVGFHGHYEKGYKNGAKIGGYFVNGRDGISRVVTYVADENGYRPKVKLINLGLDSSDTPKPDSEKTFGLQSFEFVWYPIE
ncbi:hypothetical protein GWI33_012188, partial [Rhynchophorus ferrugineus]